MCLYSSNTPLPFLFQNCCVMRYTTASQLWNIISPREFVDFSYTVGHKEGLLSCGNDLKNLIPHFILNI